MPVPLVPLRVKWNAVVHYTGVLVGTPYHAKHTEYKYIQYGGTEHTIMMLTTERIRVYVRRFSCLAVESVLEVVI